MLRWAIIGTGFISTTMAEAIGRSDGSLVEVIYGRSAERASEFAEVYGIERSSNDMTSLTADSSIDVVYIASPNHVHLEHVLVAAAAGKAILCEKSLTTTITDAHSLIDAVRDRSLFVEGLMYLAHPLMGRFAELLTNGALGQVRSVYLRYAAAIADLVNPAGGGTIYNLGCYPVSLLQFVMHTCFDADAFRHRQLSGHGLLTADDTIGSANTSIRFDNGVLATISSTDEYGMAHHCSIATDLGELRIETNPWLPIAGDNVISWTPYDGQREIATVTATIDAFDAQVQMVERSIAAGRTEAERPSPSLDDSLDIMRFLTDWESHCRR